MRSGLLIAGAALGLLLPNAQGDHGLSPRSSAPSRPSASQGDFAPWPQPADITVERDDGNATCVGTMVARRELGRGVCEVAFITAAHCLRAKTGQMVKTMQVDFPEVGGGPKLAFGYDRVSLWLQQDSSRERDDAAVFRDKVSCASLGDRKPARLAACVDGRVSIPPDATLYMHKRLKPVGENQGGGHKYPVRFEGVFGRSRHQMYSYSSTTHRTYPGDSGAPIANERGEIVSVHVRSRDSTHLAGEFDSKAVCRVAAALRRWGLAPSGAGTPSTGPLLASGPGARGEAPVAAARSASASPASTSSTGPTPPSSRSSFSAPSPGQGHFVGIENSPNGPFLSWVPPGGTRREVVIQPTPTGGVLLGYTDPSSGGWRPLPAAAHEAVVDYYASLFPDTQSLDSSFDQEKDRELARRVLASRPSQTHPSSAASQPSPAGLSSIASRPLPPIRPVGGGEGGTRSIGSSASGRLEPAGSHSPPPERPIRPSTPAALPHAGLYSLEQCKSCHQPGGKAPAFPAFVENPAAWDRLLSLGDASAKQWLAGFNRAVVHGEMLGLAKLNSHEGAGGSIIATVRALAESHLDPGELASRAPSDPARAAFVKDQSSLNLYTRLLKTAPLEDEYFKAELENFDVIWDSHGNPPWSWAAARGAAGKGGARPVETSPPPIFVEGEIIVRGSDGKWQWKAPFHKGFASDDKTRGLQTFTLMRFPRDKNGKIIKGVRDTERHRGNENDELPSLFGSVPAGTLTVEVDYSIVNGKPVIIDIVSQRKQVKGNKAEWVPDGHRRDSSPQAVRAWLQRQPDKGTNQDLIAIRRALDSPQRDAIQSDLGRGNGGTPFVMNGRLTGTISGSKSVVPRGLNPRTLDRFYSELPLRSAVGSKGWQLEFQDVFAQSHRGIPIDSKTCTNCHQFSGEPVRNVFRAAGVADSNVSRYVNLSGYDRILSAPWFPPDVLAQFESSGNTQNNPPRIPRPSQQMRPELAPFFEPYSPERHPKSLYRSTQTPMTGTHPLRGP